MTDETLQSLIADLAAMTTAARIFVREQRAFNEKWSTIVTKPDADTATLEQKALIEWHVAEFQRACNEV